MASASAQRGRNLQREAGAGIRSGVAAGARLPRRSASTLPKDVLFLPMPKLSPSMVRMVPFIHARSVLVYVAIF